MLIFLFVIAKVNKEELGTEGLKRINVPIVQGEVVLGSQGKAFPEENEKGSLAPAYQSIQNGTKICDIKSRLALPAHFPQIKESQKSLHGGPKETGA